MIEQPEFEKNKIYSVSNFVYWLIMTNLMFGLAILPTGLAILFIEPIIANILLYFLVLLPVGPALGGLVASMIHLKEKNDLNPLREYWQYYKNNFKDSLKTWSVFLIVFIILIVDLYYISAVLPSFATILSIIFLILMVILVLVMIPALLISIKFQFLFKDLFKLSAFYAITRLKLSIGNACIVFLTIFVMEMTIDFIPLFFASLLVYLLVNYNYDVLSDIQKKYVK